MELKIVFEPVLIIHWNDVPLRFNGTLWISKELSITTYKGGSENSVYVIPDIRHWGIEYIFVWHSILVSPPSITVTFWGPAVIFNCPVV